MTRQDFLYKWGLYGLALLLIFVLQTMVFSQFQVFGVCPMLVPVAVAVVAVWEGPAGGAGFGIAAGVLCDASLYNTDGFFTIVLMLAGLLSGLAAEHVLNSGFLSSVLCSLGSLVGIDLIRSVEMLIREQPTMAALLRVAVPEVLYSLVFVIPVYWIMKGVYNRVGGVWTT